MGKLNSAIGLTCLKLKFPFLIAVFPVFLMEKIFLFEVHDALYHGQCVRSGETHPEIVNKQEQTELPPKPVLNLDMAEFHTHYVNSLIQLITLCLTRLRRLYNLVKGLIISQPLFPIQH